MAQATQTQPNCVSDPSHDHCRLTNCQLATQGGTTYPCSPRQSLHECTQALTDRAYALFVEFLTHADR